MTALSDIPGVLSRHLTTIADERGAFAETFRQEWLPDAGAPVVQSNVSRSRAGVLRGMHFHLTQTDWWVVLEGVAFVALCDLRPGSPVRGRAATQTLDADAGLTALCIPAGVAHGFCAISGVVLQYMVTAYHDGSDERGFAWNDPDAAIPWPVAQPTLSERDRTNPSLAQMLLEPGLTPLAQKIDPSDG